MIEIPVSMQEGSVGNSILSATVSVVADDSVTDMRTVDSQLMPSAGSGHQ